MHQLTKFDIEKAKRACSNAENLHEHDDCVRIAYEWLDAQTPIKKARSKAIHLKHVIESWAGRYVSQSDVEVAVYLHPYFKGNYPFYNFSSKLVEPSVRRLEHIKEAFTQPHYQGNHDASMYRSKE